MVNGSFIYPLSKKKLLIRDLCEWRPDAMTSKENLQDMFDDFCLLECTGWLAIGS